MSASEPQRGAYFERQTQAHLRDNGYWCMKSPASKGAVDLVAIKPGQVLFVQCKLGGYMGPAERRELWDVAESAGAVPLVATRLAPGVVGLARLVAREGKPMDIWGEFTIDEVA